MPKFKILIDRKIKGSICTQGYVFVNGVAIGYTLELPDLANQSYISSIPKDIYKSFIRTDGSKGWRIELVDVPDRDNVQIHVGNYTSQIKGCILVGENVNIDNCSVSNSQIVMDKLKTKFKEYASELDNDEIVEIEVEISGI